MGNGLSLDIAMNTREVIKGAGDIGEALEEVSDSLDQVARDGDDSIEDLEQSFSDAMRDMVDESRRAGGELGDNIAEGAQAASESTEGIGESADGAHVSLGRLTSGGKRLLQGDLGGAAEFVANKLTALGPAGAVAGAVAAIGIGLVTSEMQRQQEEAKKLRERFAGMYKEALEESRTFLSQAQIQTEVMDLMWNPERAEEYKKVQEDAKTLGLDLITVLKAQAGDQQALNDVLTISNTKYDEAAEKAQERWTSVGGNVQAGIQAESKSLEGLRDRYQQISDAQQENQQKAEQSQVVLDQLRKDERDQIKRTRDADAARYDALAAAQRKAANPPPIVQQLELDTDRLERDFARWRRRFTTGSGAKVTIVADVVDRYGRRVD